MPFISLESLEAQAANIAEFGETCCCAISTKTVVHPEDKVMDHVIYDWDSLR